MIFGDYEYVALVVYSDHVWFDIGYYHTWNKDDRVIGARIFKTSSQNISQKPYSTPYLGYGVKKKHASLSDDRCLSHPTLDLSAWLWLCIIMSRFYICYPSNYPLVKIHVFILALINLLPSIAPFSLFRLTPPGNLISLTQGWCWYCQWSGAIILPVESLEVVWAQFCIKGFPCFVALL